MTEINGYPNYLIFRNGSVLSRGNKYNKPRFLKHSLNTQPKYYYVNLYKDGKPKPHYIHRLIGLHFIDNPEDKRCIDHINRDRLDNRLCNLRWATHSENSLNTGLRKDNTSGYKGVSWEKSRNKWSYKKKRYKTIEEILLIYDK